MKRDQIVWGLALIAAGVVFFIFQFRPDLFELFSWPWIMIAIGAVFVLASLLTRTGGLMIPGFIVGGLGGIFLWQTETGQWGSWSYMWTLIPGLVGLGLFVGSLFDPEMRDGRAAGLWLTVFSAIAFLLFGGLFGIGAEWTRFWPVLLIVLGAFILVRSLWRSREDESKETGEIE